MQIGPGTHVLVTGASRGIGAAVANVFAARSCTVGRVARSGEIAADVADPASIARAVAEFGELDVLVANAGIAHHLPSGTCRSIPSTSSRRSTGWAP